MLWGLWYTGVVNRSTTLLYTLVYKVPIHNTLLYCGSVDLPVYSVSTTHCGSVYFVYQSPHRAVCCGSVPLTCIPNRSPTHCVVSGLFGIQVSKQIHIQHCVVDLFTYLYTKDPIEQCVVDLFTFINRSRRTQHTAVWGLLVYTCSTNSPQQQCVWGLLLTWYTKVPIEQCVVDLFTHLYTKVPIEQCVVDLVSNQIPQHTVYVDLWYTGIVNRSTTQCSMGTLVYRYSQQIHNTLCIWDCILKSP